MNKAIGTLLEFDKDSGKASVSFYVNGKSMGIAYPSLPAGKYYPLLSVLSNP
jgi:hypothetical protein